MQETGLTVKKFLYDEMTWPEIKQVVEEERVVLIPTATIEDHGHHLPIGTDVTLAWEVARRAAERVPEDVVLMPPSPHGYSPHHADFPGGIYIEGRTFPRPPPRHNPKPHQPRIQAHPNPQLPRSNRPGSTSPQGSQSSSTPTRRSGAPSPTPQASQSTTGGSRRS